MSGARERAIMSCSKALALYWVGFWANTAAVTLDIGLMFLNAFTFVTAGTMLINLTCAVALGHQIRQTKALVSGLRQLG